VKEHVVPHHDSEEEEEEESKRYKGHQTGGARTRLESRRAIVACVALVFLLSWRIHGMTAMRD
jgi:hypothetical protein